MSTYIPPTTVRHKVGTCPACRGYLWADVGIAVEVAEPTLDADGQPHVRARPIFTDMHLEHHCEREGEA